MGSRARRRGVTAFLLAAVLGASGTPAMAEPMVDITGHGWGHGRGMGQYGALGYAIDHGWDHARILDHFYGGTRPGAIGNPGVRVLLMGQEGRDTITYQEGQRLAHLVRRVGEASFHIYDGPGCGGPWTFRQALNIPEVVIAPVVRSENLADMLQLCLPEGTRWYRGDLIVNGSSTQHTINALDMESYLRGVVPRESPAWWGDLNGGAGMNALRAQAVAARSYAASESRWPYAKTCDTTQCQVYLGRAQFINGAFTDLEDARSNRSVAETAGVIRERNGGPARTEFSSSTGGYTAGGAFPAVPDDGDDTSRNPNHTWTAQIPFSALEARYGLGPFQSLEVTERNGLGDFGGRVLGMRLYFAGGEVVRTGDQFRSEMGLKSNWFRALVPQCANEVPGYILDGYGGLHPVGGATAPSSGPYWPGWDIARDVGATGGSGYVLDGWGGLHAFNGRPPAQVSGYWPWWDIARAVAVRPDGTGAYVLDGYGGVHPAAVAGSMVPAVASTEYWPGWDIARDIALDPTDPARGWVLDGWGGMHPFGGAPPVTVTGYWSGWDVARRIVMNPSGLGGWVVDAYGGLHPFAPQGTPNPGPRPNPAYPVHSTRDAIVSSAGGGHVINGLGSIAVVNTGCITSPRWPGWDIVRAFAPSS